MNYIEANKEAWGKLSKDHYESFRERLKEKDFALNPIVKAELGDVRGKRILHLQCNTGADSILLAREGAIVTGVDLVDDNVHYAKMLAKELHIDNVDFIASNVLELDKVHSGKYDIVMTTDGAIGWLPDLNAWGKVISTFLKEDGFFYLHDGHPFMMIFDENQLDEGKLIPKYPYFSDDPDPETEIGGYASEPKEAINYYWGHRLESIVNGLLCGNLYISYLKEYDYCVSGMGGSKIKEDGMMYYPELSGKLPIVISIKAVKGR